MYDSPVTLSVAPTREPTQLAGTLVVGRREALEQLVGAGAYQRALESIDDELRTKLTQATSLTWVPIADIERFVIACAEASGEDVYELNVESARRSTAQGFRTVWRLFLRMATDSMLLSRTARAYDRAYDRGRVEIVVNQGRPGGSCEIFGRPEMSRMARDAFGVGVETVLQLGGRGTVAVHGRATPDGAAYVIHRE